MGAQPAAHSTVCTVQAHTYRGGPIGLTHSQITSNMLQNMYVFEAFNYFRVFFLKKNYSMPKKGKEESRVIFCGLPCSSRELCTLSIRIYSRRYSPSSLFFFSFFCAMTTHFPPLPQKRKNPTALSTRMCGNFHPAVGRKE